MVPRSDPRRQEAIQYLYLCMPIFKPRCIPEAASLSQGIRGLAFNPLHGIFCLWDYLGGLPGRIAELDKKLRLGYVVAIHVS